MNSDLLLNTTLALAAVGSMVAAFWSVGQGRKQGKAVAAIAASMERVSKSYEADLKSLRGRVEAMQGAVSMADVRRQELEHKKREAEWKKTRDILKGIGWFMKNAEPED